ncbi:hypothetical protein CPB83DRAFT_267444 [Crepidotus variabilis]|uniref:Uncharacterized protein n=1 Tax=Crepidotus variabilis TaxID=179855 RepID=A0A9P6EIE9_9AGAR|nr:hypothetical protein CPB83DRAFT_267444 [Crepidotus variabilis]
MSSCTRILLLQACVFSELCPSHSHFRHAIATSSLPTMTLYVGIYSKCTSFNFKHSIGDSSNALGEGRIRLVPPLRLTSGSVIEIRKIHRIFSVDITVDPSSIRNAKINRTVFCSGKLYLNITQFPLDAVFDPIVVRA